MQEDDPRLGGGGNTEPDPHNPPPGYRWDDATQQFVQIQLNPGQPGYDPNTDPRVAAPPGSVAPPGTHWDPTQANYVPDQQVPPPPGPGGPPPPGGNGFGFGEQFTPPTPNSLGGPAGVPMTPQLNGPQLGTPPPFSFRDFKAPSVDDALNDPGYKFRLQQGNDNLQSWAASKGTLGDSGTAKALTDYGQGAASQEYGNVWNRDFNAWGADLGKELGAYNTNYQTQYYNPWQAQEQNWIAGTVNPTMTAYSTQAAANQHNNDTNYQNAFNEWLARYGIFKDKRDTTIDFASR